MNKCEHCGSIFEEPEYANLPEGEFGFCPFCHQDNYHKVVQCLGCDKWIDDDGEWYCNDCQYDVGEVVTKVFVRDFKANFEIEELEHLGEFILDSIATARHVALCELKAEKNCYGVDWDREPKDLVERNEPETRGFDEYGL